MAPALTVREAARILAQGGLVAFPTETVYGLGADARNPDAVLRIFAAKNRPSFNPLICHLPDAGSVFRFGRESENARKLAEFWPGPLTLLLPHEGRIPSVVTAGSPLCGFRVPRHPIARELLALVAGPIAAPSANKSGRVSPVTAAMVQSQLGRDIDGLLDGGPCKIGLESTVILPEENFLRILRPGAVTREELEERGFTIRDEPGEEMESESESENKGAPLSPGRLSAHYAPAVPLALTTKTDPLRPDDRDAVKEACSAAGLNARRLCLLGFGPEEDSSSPDLFNLSRQGDLLEAARNLFAFFDRADNEGFDLILARTLPDRGLGRAINDRLRRAARFLVHFSPNAVRVEIVRKEGFSG